MTPAIEILQAELRCVRAFRVSKNFAVARAALDREEELLAEIATAEGRGSNVLPMAAGFARRDGEPEGKAET